MPHRSLRLLLVLLSSCLACACQGVDVVFNEQVVYTDADLYTDYDIPDPGLRGCVERAILERRMSAAQQLRNLHCIEAGVVSLDGLDTFSNLQRLDLTGNFELPCSELDKLPGLDTLILPDQCQ